MKKTLPALLYIFPLLTLLALGVYFFRTPSASTHTASAKPATPKAPALSASPPSKAPNFQWGNAENSAAMDGTGFFDRERRQIFCNHLASEDRPYVINLLSRALLPKAGVDAAESVLNPNPAALQTVYLQFPDQLDEMERKVLSEAGLELLNYVDGRAWTVRATSADLRRALMNGTARAAAAIDPRDKLNAAVYAQNVPAYAQTEDGRVRFNVITQVGVQANDFNRLGAADIDAAELRPSVLGSRFGVEMEMGTAEALANLDAVSYIDFGTPPVQARDAILDNTSNINDVRDNAPNLSGAGINVAVREIGHPLVHQDLEGQLNFIETTGANSLNEVGHSSAVCGVIAGKASFLPQPKASRRDRKYSYTRSTTMHSALGHC